MQIQKKGGIGIRSLGTMFRRMDNNGNKKLDQGEFTEALAKFRDKRSILTLLTLIIASSQKLLKSKPY